MHVAFVVAAAPDRARRTHPMDTSQRSLPRTRALRAKLGAPEGGFGTCAVVGSSGLLKT